MNNNYYIVSGKGLREPCEDTPRLVMARAMRRLQVASGRANRKRQNRATLRARTGRNDRAEVLSKVAAGHIGTPAAQRNVRRALIAQERRRLKEAGVTNPIDYADTLIDFCHKYGMTLNGDLA